MTRQAMAIAARYQRSHVARVALAGLDYLHSAPTIAPTMDVVEFVSGGMQCSAARVHREMQSGLNALATIGATAPFVGMFGTVIGIVNSFRGGSNTPSGWLAVTATGLAEALLTTATGLFAAVFAVWCFNYFAAQMEGFDVEMETSRLELITLAVRFRKRSPPAGGSTG